MFAPLPRYLDVIFLASSSRVSWTLVVATNCGGSSRQQRRGTEGYRQAAFRSEMIGRQQAANLHGVVGEERGRSDPLARIALGLQRRQRACRELRNNTRDCAPMRRKAWPSCKLTDLS